MEVRNTSSRSCHILEPHIHSWSLMASLGSRVQAECRPKRYRACSSPTLQWESKTLAWNWITKISQILVQICQFRSCFSTWMQYTSVSCCWLSFQKERKKNKSYLDLQSISLMSTLLWLVFRDFSLCALIKDRNPLCVPGKIQRSSAPLLQLFRVLHATSVSSGSNAVKLQVWKDENALKFKYVINFFEHLNDFKWKNSKLESCRFRRDL